jgi:hypothetical protein
MGRELVDRAENLEKFRILLYVKNQNYLDINNLHVTSHGKSVRGGIIFVM